MILELTPNRKPSSSRSSSSRARSSRRARPAIDESGEFPTDVMHAAAAHGLLGVTIPTAWGGAGRDYVSYALAIEAIARASATVAVSLSVTNSLVAELIAHAGTRRRSSERWLRAARDAARRSARSRCRSPTPAPTPRISRPTAVQTGDGYRITGRKVWVANAEAASVAIVFACTRPGLRGQGVTAFLVPMDTPGHHARRRAPIRSASAASAAWISSFDITVGDEQVLGPRRSGIPARDVGARRAAAWRSPRRRSASARRRSTKRSRYAKQREQFGQPIANYQAIQWMLADMATELDAGADADAGRRRRARIAQERARVEASMAKLAASEAAHSAADKAMQILASAGYRRGSVVERLFRDVRATEIYQGTSEAQRMIIAEAVLGDSRI